MKITRLKVSNYRGITTLDTAIGASGATISGRNGGGKTTTLNAIRAALSGLDVGPDAIRNGADKAEILIDVDDVSIRRLITKKQSTLTVKKGGMEAKAPVRFLAELLGDCALDPLDLITKKKAERKAVILSALPIAVTREQLDAVAPGLPADFSTDGHGLDVVGRAHEHFYAIRKDANAAAKAASTEAERLNGLVPTTVQAAPSVDEAVAAFKEAQRALANEEADARALAAAIERAKASTEKAAALKARADAIDVSGVDAAERNSIEAQRVLAEAREQLAKASEVFAAANAAHASIVDAAREKSALTREAEALVQGTGIPDVKPDVEGARARLAKAEEAGRAARALDDATKAAKAAQEAKGKAAAAEAEAKRLDGIVRALADDLPAQLLEASKGIPGLSLLGDDVAWKGVALGSLCGAEQVRICVEVARRLNERAKILVVDGLERLDPEQLDVFLAEATRDGWQLIASRVDRGDVVIEAIEAGEEAAAAE